VVATNRFTPSATVVPILVYEDVGQTVDRPFGERQYAALDLADHWWTFSPHVADLAPEDWGGISARP
jgi:hypothetical protein